MANAQGCAPSRSTKVSEKRLDDFCIRPARRSYHHAAIATPYNAHPAISADAMSLQDFHNANEKEQKTGCSHGPAGPVFRISRDGWVISTITRIEAELYVSGENASRSLIRSAAC
jgi:hypothetical protein